jgi:membrane associated rhomboid family serine protease
VFFILPIQVKNAGSQKPLPIANMALVAVNVVLYFLAAGFGWHLWVGSGSSLWSVIAYAFAHGNLMHLAVNMWVLWLFGNPVNRRIGNFYYVLSYLGTAVSLGLIYWFCGSRPLLGSSAVIFAILFLFMMLMPSATIRVGYLALAPLTLIVALFSRPANWIGWLCRWGSFQVGARTAMAIAVLLELAGVFWTGWNWVTLAHLSGLLCGVVIVLLLPERITTRRELA